MFVVKKKIGNNEYYYLRKSIREDGKVKAKTIAYLGKTLKDAERKKKEIIKKMSVKTNTMVVNSVERDEKIEELNGKETKITIEELASFCKRKGFVYPSGDIYGGFAGFWDFGHLGVELKNNIKKDWWNYHVYGRDDVVGIDGSIITNPRVWEASGHIEGFSDVFVVCKKCKKAGKIDGNEIEKAEKGEIRCDFCGGEYDVKSAKEFKLMFKTDVGTKDAGYLRPETAQLIFTNFKAVHENARMQLPFGIAQIGKAFRNEIAPRDFLFRMREFEQMEIEYFADPSEKCKYLIGDSEILVLSDEMQEGNIEAENMKFKDAFKKGIIKTDWHAYWLEQEFLWFVGLGANRNKFRIRQHEKDEKSHYAVDTWDLEYNFPFGWKELQGMANRGDFDLKQHEKFSGKSMEITKTDGMKIIPSVICEPSQGLERAMLVFLFNAYTYDKERDNIILKLSGKLAPVKCAIFPIVKKPEFEELALKIYGDLKKEFNVVYDKSGSVGRRYARQDEIGTPYCIVIDGDSLKKKDATIRDRDTGKQVRIKIKDLKNAISAGLDGENIFEFGKIVDTRKEKSK
ncbi:MAG: glycine--tRNA ligase [Candidatus Pacearchaeota archaeon]|nr:glycine--tRNA ligase [Candidatus Pacearchaeota archaeon]